MHKEKQTTLWIFIAIAIVVVVIVSVYVMNPKGLAGTTKPGPVQTVEGSAGL